MENVAKKIVRKMAAYKVISSSKQQYYVYGLTLVLASFLITFYMVLSAVIFSTIITAIAYISVYWFIHSTGNAHHCKKYSQCFILSASIYTAMLALVIFANTKTEIVLAVLLVISTIATVITRSIEMARVGANNMKYVIFNIISIAISIVVLNLGWVEWAFPFSYGMYAINILQEKVRKDYE